MLGFGECLTRELPKLGIEPSVISPVARLGKLGKSAKSRKWLAYADKYLLFPKSLRKAAANSDVIHVLDHGNAMYTSQLPPDSHLITCHDLLAMRAAGGEIDGWHVGPSGRKYQELIKKGLKKSNLIACVSQATLEDVSRVLNRAPERIRLIYNGQYQVLPTSSPEELSALRKTLELPSKFLLHVGGDSVYKNRQGLLEIYQQLHKLLVDQCPSLILAGRPLPEGSLSQIERDAPGKVRVIDSPDRDQLSSLYQMATALVFPSTHEGFGLPILEAQSLGCPVFTSNRSPMLEVGGEAAVYFDPLAPLEAAKTVAAQLGNLDQMKNLGLQQSSKFSTRAMVTGYAKLYKEIKS